MDLFVVPTIGFDLLYVFVIVRLDRRQLVWVNVTTNPTAEWIARATSRHKRSSVGFITATFGFRFSVHTGGADRISRRSHCPPGSNVRVG
jgi:hypothetical protein